MTKPKKLSKTANVILILTILFGIGAISRCSQDVRNSDARMVLDAAVACGKEFKGSARYDYDLCETCTLTTDDGNYINVSLTGKMSNAFGSWSDFSATCMYSKAHKEVKRFNLTDG